MTTPGTGTRRRKVLRYARSKPPTQWDQPNDVFENGATGCSATAVQFVLGLHGIKVTLKQIARAVGYPDANQKRNDIGLYDHQVVEALAHWGVRYQYTTDKTAQELLSLSTSHGPVLFACTYRWWPQRRGATYGSIHADGRPNGYARLEGKGGKDQLGGFEDGRHMGVLLSRYHRSGTPTWDTKVYLWDPNHGSALRPSVPDYDVISPNQWQPLYGSARTTSKNGKPMACIPLEVLR